MSSTSDQVAFAESLEPQDNTILYQSKKWAYIIDSSSSSGVFNGQIQFDLNTLSSQSQWTDLSQAYIQFPIKLSITNNTAITTEIQTGLDNFAASIKNGFHQFVDSVSVVLGGANIQSQQIFENVNASYKILSEWSVDELKKYGPSLGIALDDYQLAADAASTYTGLDNAPIATLSPAYVGVQYPANRNTGFKERCQMYNSDAVAANTTTATTILGSNAVAEGKGRVQAIGAASATLTNTQEVYVQFMLATVRLKDVSDAISKLPLVKGLKGFIYVNYNAASTQFSLNASAATFSAAPTMQSIYGRSMPAMLNSTIAASTTAKTLTFKAEVSAAATTGSALTSATSTFNNARLFAPYYIASPEVDRALSMKKTIRFNERFVTTFTMNANGGTYSGTLSPGITNPQRVILLPLLTGSATSTAGTASFAVNPLLSPWDTAGCGTSSPFAGLKDLQLTVGGQPMWQSPQQFQYENYLQEVAQQGTDGGLVSQRCSGLLSQRLWNQMYRYYTCDVSRRMGSDDGASKAVQLSCTNATTAPMTVIAMIWYQREIVIDTALGQVQQSM